MTSVILTKCLASNIKYHLFLYLLGRPIFQSCPLMRKTKKLGRQVMKNSSFKRTLIDQISIGVNWCEHLTANSLETCSGGSFESLGSEELNCWPIVTL